MVTFFSAPRIGASGENLSPPTTGHRKKSKFPSFNMNPILLGFHRISHVLDARYLTRRVTIT